MPSSCALSSWFAIGAWVSLLWQHSTNAKCQRVLVLVLCLVYYCYHIFIVVVIFSSRSCSSSSSSSSSSSNNNHNNKWSKNFDERPDCRENFSGDNLKRQSTASAAGPSGHWSTALGENRSTRANESGTRWHLGKSQRHQPQKCPHLYAVPWDHPSPHPKLYLDQFTHLCRVPDRWSLQTDRPTDHTTLSVTIGHI